MLEADWYPTNQLSLNICRQFNNIILCTSKHKGNGFSFFDTDGINLLLLLSAGAWK